MRVRDLTGQKSGKLTAVKYLYSKNKRRRWLVRCDCGETKDVSASDFTSGRLVSCGCHKIDVVIKRNKTDLAKHNMTGSRTWITWFTMRQRCRDPRATGHKYYYDRGVKYDKRWNDFNEFLKDMGERPEGMSLDRINPHGNYTKDNCRWATAEVQANNTRAKYDLHCG